MTNRDALMAFLERELEVVKVRKGPHSKIAKTLDAALRSGTTDDLDAGKLASDHFHRDGEQYTLEEMRSKVHASNRRRELRDEKERAQKLREDEKRREDQRRQDESQRWANGVLDKIAKRPQFSEARVSDGIDFSRPDRMSTSRMRHVIASRSRKRRAAKRATKARTKKPNRWK